MTLHVVGVRHHSPACAALVRDTLRAVRPRWVLVEGPADFNPRMGELLLGHTPPVALFSFHFADDRRHASWAPFCVYSPEWIALHEGSALGADVRFVDLPAWDHGMDGLENRYADGPLADPDVALAEALGEQGTDAAWDVAFELPPPDGLQERLTTYFRGLRERMPASASDLRREAYMARWVRWALGQGGEVVVVCGGFHAPVLEGLTPDPEAGEPEVPAPTTDRSATWLIPYDERRLDSFAGYASGMPSPAWYRWVWTEGVERAGPRGLEATATGLRARGQVVSVADTVAAWTQATALARVRGHRAVARVDLLDAVVSTWVKEALPAPVPWSARTALRPGTHPVLVELVARLSGDLRGTLHPDTPLPPLVHHVEAVRRQHDLQAAAAPRTLTLRRGDPRHEERRLALERLVLLGVAGITRAAREPTFVIQDDPMGPTSVLEAAAYGPTLEDAALAKLEERAREAEGFVALVAVLEASVRTGLPGLSARALADLDAVAREEHRLDVLGDGLHGLLGVVRHGGLSDADRAAVAVLVDTSLDRGLWLVEGVQGQGPVDLGRVAAVQALRDAAMGGVTVDPDRVRGVFERVADDPAAPLDLRGSALGALASLGHLTADGGADRASAVLAAVEPTRLGDYLAGLLRLAREVLSDGEGLLRAVDASLAAMDEVAFLAALPSLRVAFHQLPTRERADVGRSVAALHGRVGARLTARLAHDPALVARGMALEALAEAWRAHLGVP
ncbi:MAG: hypothetical protein H6736_02475 [Alphaproteobacteria bacterium]|nr:hypothetical protein [Alphaproteobacteria bacterium]MCB9690657.1 hypothetical protein [Alphaproteobacteria bacterium]